MPSNSRRHVLGGMVTGLIAATALPTSAKTRSQTPSLKSLALDKGIFFGTAIPADTLRSQWKPQSQLNSPSTVGQRQVPSTDRARPVSGAPVAGGAAPPGGLVQIPGGSDADYLALIRHECAILVPENAMKLNAVMRSPDRLDFTDADLIVAFARQNRMKLRGHNLLWNHPQFLPKWLLERDFGTDAKSGTERWLRSYIARVCAHFERSVCSWDVVNEAIDPKTGELRETPFNKAWGRDALRIAFEAARQNAPDAQLVYNDYMSWEGDHAAHRSGVLRLLEYFKKNAVPVDALGIQSHIVAVHALGSKELRNWTAFVDEVAGMGYRLLITEFDVNDVGLSPDPVIRDRQVADAARQYLDLMLSYEQLDQVLAWGLADNHSWLQSAMLHGYNKGKPLRPTPFDSFYRPKPLTSAIAQALRAAPKRTPSRFLL